MGDSYDLDMGNGYVITFDHNPSDSEINMARAQAAPEMGQAAQPKQQGFLGKVWDKLGIPEQKSKEGLTKIAQSIPQYSGAVPGAIAAAPLTALVGPAAPLIGAAIGEKLAPSSNQASPSLAQNLVTGAPRVAADTMAEVAPKFVDKASLISMGIGGAIKAAGAIPGVADATNSAGRFVGEQAEKASGLAYKRAGVLARTVNDPLRPIGKGLDAVSQEYEDAKGGVDAIRQEFKDIPSKLDFVKAALLAAKDGSLTSEEALAARKMLDKSKDAVSDLFFGNAREVLDGIAKKDFAGPDEAWQRALDSEALRNVFALNKSGSPSIVKGTLAYLKPGLKYLLSPAAQGAVASGVGMAKSAIQAPIPTAATGSIIDAIHNILAKRKQEHQ